MDSTLENMKKADLIAELKYLRIELNRIQSEIKDKKRETVDLHHQIEDQNLHVQQQNNQLRETQLLLEQSRDLYADLYDYAPVGYLTLDSKGIINAANLTSAEMLNLPRKKLIGMPFNAFLAKENFSAFYQHLKKLQEHNSKDIVEVGVYVKNQVRCYQLDSIPVKNYADNTTEFRVVLSDISYRKDLEKKIKENEEHLSAMFTQVVVGFGQIDLQGNFLRVNKKYQEITGRTEDELLKLNILDITFPDDVENKKTSLNNLSSGSPYYTYEKRYLKPDNTVVWVNNSATLITDEQNTPEFIVIVVEDITTRKAAEEALHESESRFRLMADTTPAFVWMTDASGNTIYVNKSRVDFCGGTVNDQLGKGWQNFIHPNDLERLKSTAEEVNEAKRKFQHEYRLRSVSGKYIWVFDTGIPRFTEKGDFAGYIGSGSDITEIKEAEEKLKISYEREKELRLQTEEGENKLAFLAEAMAILNSSLDYNITLKSLAHLVTPQLADWCVVDLLNENDELNRVAVSHIDPEKVKLAEELGRKFGPKKDEATGLWNVVRTGKSELYPEISEELIRLGSRDEEHYRITLELGLESAMIVPLKIREKVFGTITLIYAKSHRKYDEDDLLFVEDLANRAALAIDNARLYSEANNLNQKLEERIAELNLEIEERKKARKALLASEEKFRQLAENINSVFYIIDPSLKKIVYLSPAFKNIWGIKPELIYQNPGIWIEFIHPDDRQRLSEQRQEFYLTELDIEYRIIRGDKRERWIHTKSFPLRNEHGEVYRIVGISEDVTARKNTEEQIRTSLRDKEVLLREIHHRVKNNLQIISSLLSLQSTYIKDEHALEVFTDSQNRVKSMALVHEKLYQRKDLSSLNFEEYVKELTGMLVQTYRIKARMVHFRIEIDNVILNVDMAIGLGLIINELVSNTFKHAFPGDMKGEVCISVRIEKNNSLTVRIEDNGIGFPPDINFKKTDSLGLQLVNTLVEQHWGKIELHSNGGAHFKITFPELKYR